MIDPSEITPTTQNNALSETTHRASMGEEDDYPPTPDARRPNPYETDSGKEQDGEEDLEKAYREYHRKPAKWKRVGRKQTNREMKRNDAP